MRDSIDDLLAEFRWADRPATDGEINQAESSLGARLPRDYLAVLRQHDGGEGFVGSGEYLALWPVSELAANNQTLNAGRLIPDSVLIGTNGGNEVFAFRPSSGTYWSYPAVGMSADAGKPLGDSWESFLKALSTMA